MVIRRRERAEKSFTRSKFKIETRIGRLVLRPFSSFCPSLNLFASSFVGSEIKAPPTRFSSLVPTSPSLWSTFSKACNITSHLNFFCFLLFYKSSDDKKGGERKQQQKNLEKLMIRPLYWFV